ncbi:S-adenosyl-L-methionine-dependent methyltransferase [Lenzites betulinus]|nr:S-adenosyl-L-methionine-dependent methyltransferase [Lenzites betulinus]
MNTAPRVAPKTNLAAVAVTRVVAIVVLLGLSLVTFKYKHALEPLYGTAPVDLHLSKVIWAASILGSLAPSVPISRATLGLGLLLYALPYSSYWVAVYTGRLGDPIWGPVATHLVVLLPILSLGVAIVKALQEAPYAKDDASAPQSSMTLPVCATAINALLGLWPAVSLVTAQPENTIFLGLGTLCTSLWVAEPFVPDMKPAPLTVTVPEPIVSSTPSKSKKGKKNTPEKATTSSPSQSDRPQSQAKMSGSYLRLGLLPLFPLMTTAILGTPTLPKPLLETYTHPSEPLRILSSVRSDYSGVVVVGETLQKVPGQLGALDHLRYLRAGHSLLGGVWVGPKARYEDPAFLTTDEAGDALGDSIYTTFVFQEAARLVVKKPGHGTPKNALMIGLGAGIAATSFDRHGLDVTIVEIDQTVYDAAHRFFGLPTPGPGRLFIEDARLWVNNRSTTLTGSTTTTAPVADADLASPELYDIIVHDLFSGGGLPGHLFSAEFWADLKNILRPDGVVVVNFAGILMSDSGKAIVNTLHAAFPQCRGFYDSIEQSQNVTTEFLNWVLFCTPSPGKLEFRKPVDADFLGSYLRRHVFNELPARETDLALVLDSIPEDKREQYLLKDSANPLVQWQAQEALGHWKIMREVLPHAYWETY